MDAHQPTNITAANNILEEQVKSLSIIVEDLRFKVHALNERLKEVESNGKQKQSGIFGFKWNIPTGK